MRAAVILLLLAGPAAAVPVVPQFRTGQQTTHTRSTTQISESIRSVDFATGYTYSASGTGVEHDGARMLPSAIERQTQTTEGVQSQWLGLPLQERPAWRMTTPGGSFQWTEHYSGPGLQTITTIERTTSITSDTSSTSVFGP